MSTKKIISIVIPVLNEEDNIFPLYEKLMEVFKVAEETYEIIYVDDGSSDSSLEKIRQLRAKDPKIKTISFTRNFGHQVAITAGMEYSSGDAIIVMDADLQHPPEVIPEMIAKWKEGCEVVFTIRKDTMGVSFFKKITSNLFYKIINYISDTEVPPNAADFRLMSRRTVNYLNNLSEQSRFIRGLTSWLGFTQASIEIESPKRLHGQTKYSLRKMMKFATQGITSFSNYPLIISFYIGVIVSSTSFLYIIYIVYSKYIEHTAIPGWPSILITLLLLGGLILIILGIIGVYIGQILIELRNRPLYVINDTEGFDPPKNQSG